MDAYISTVDPGLFFRALSIFYISIRNIVWQSARVFAIVVYVVKSLFLLLSTGDEIERPMRL